MKSTAGMIGALAYASTLVVCVMTLLLILPLALSMALPSVELTHNWSVVSIITASLIWFFAGMCVAPVVQALGQLTAFFRRAEVIIWSRRLLELALLTAFYFLFVTPEWAALISALAATAIMELTEPYLDKLLASQKGETEV